MAVEATIGAVMTGVAEAAMIAVETIEVAVAAMIEAVMIVAVAEAMTGEATTEAGAAVMTGAVARPMTIAAVAVAEAAVATTGPRPEVRLMIAREPRPGHARAAPTISSSGAFAPAPSMIMVAGFPATGASSLVTTAGETVSKRDS